MKKKRFIKLVVILLKLLLFSFSMPFALQFAVAEDEIYNNKIYIEEIGLTATAPEGWYVDIVSKQKFQETQLGFLKPMIESGKIDKTELKDYLAKEFTPRLVSITKYSPGTEDPLQPAINIVVQRSPGGEIRERKIKTLRKLASLFGSHISIIEEPVEAIINDRKYIKYIICEEDALIIQSYVLDYNNLTYSIDMRCDKTKFENYQRIFDEFIDNLIIK